MKSLKKKINLFAVTVSLLSITACEKAETGSKNIENNSGSKPNYVLLLDFSTSSTSDNKYIDCELYTDDLSFIPKLNINGQSFPKTVININDNHIISARIPYNELVTFSISNTNEDILNGEIKMPTLTGLKVNNQSYSPPTSSRSFEQIYDASTEYNTEIQGTNYAKIIGNISRGTNNAIFNGEDFILTDNTTQIRRDANTSYISFFWDMINGILLMPGDKPNFSSSKANCYVKASLRFYNITIRKSAQKPSSNRQLNTNKFLNKDKNIVLDFLKSLKY